MSRFYKAFAHGEIGRLTREEEDSISRGLVPYRFLRASPRMAPFTKRASSWGRGRSFGGGTQKAKRRLFWGGTLARGFGRASYGRNLRRTGGYTTSMERKFHDVTVDDASITQAGTIQNGGTINLIAQGTGESQRIGRKLTIKSILWKWNVKRVAFTGTSSAVSETVRLILYKDTQCNGATATAALILQTDNYQSFKNLENGSRFQILMDKTLTFNVTSGAGNGTANDFGENMKNGTFYKSCHIPMEFQGVDDPAILTNIRTNNLGILVLSQVGAITSLDSQIRLRFTG